MKLNEIRTLEEDVIDVDFKNKKKIEPGAKPEEKKVDVKVAKPQKLTMMQAFGSAELNILHDAGIHLVEKPSYWEDLEAEDGPYRKYKPVTQIMLKKAENALKAKGVKLATLTSAEVYGHDPKGPLASWKGATPEPECYIIKFANGKRYLCDRTGANSYCRNWAFIVDNK